MTKDELKDIDGPRMNNYLDLLEYVAKENMSSMNPCHPDNKESKRTMEKIRSILDQHFDQPPADDVSEAVEFMNKLVVACCIENSQDCFNKEKCIKNFETIRKHLGLT